MVDKWEIIGGGEHGGVIVRTGKDLNSPKEVERLATGSTIEEVELSGDRLHYRLENGSGPSAGWISIKLKDKVLASRKGDAAANVLPGKIPKENLHRLETVPEKQLSALWTIKPGDNVPPALPAPSRPEHLTQIRQLTPWSKPASDKGASIESVIGKVAKGDLYGIEFPFTLSMLKAPEWGAGFLTKAFHAAGTMPKDNSVTKIVRLEELPMSGYDAAGGAGLKGFLTIEYAKPNPDLHTELFVKVPFGAENLTWRMNMSMFGDPDGAEISAYNFLPHLLPFRMPKMYFADIARSTTNYLQVTERILFSKKGTDCKPYQIHPAIGKYQDYEMRDPAQAYYALMRAMGRMAAWDKQGRFEGVREIFEHTTFARFGGRDKVLAGRAEAAAARAQATKEQIAKHNLEKRKTMMEALAKKWKSQSRHFDTLIRFITETAPWLWPEDVKEKEWLAELKSQMELVWRLQGPINHYCTEGEKSETYSGLMHPNLQVDNSFLWTDEDGLVHAGLLDWGGCGYMGYAGIFLGCVSGAQAEVYLEHEEWWFRTFVEEYKRFGGGDEMVAEDLIEQCRLMFAVSTCGAIGQLALRGLGEAEGTPEEEWKTITSRTDERIMGRWNCRCNVLAAEVFFTVWRRGPHFQTVLDWAKREGLPTDPF